MKMICATQLAASRAFWKVTANVMAAELRIVEPTDSQGALLATEWLTRAEPVHRQLRERLPDDYPRRMRDVFANGARMVLAVEGEVVRGLAVWRIIENTYEGRRLYIDDLVTDIAYRSRGVGHFLIAWLETHAHTLNCNMLALDSGSQRADAHRFYFRERFTISSFCFKKSLI
jgi:GNAT superfamily N-acetyltransferase